MRGGMEKGVRFVCLDFISLRYIPRSYPPLSHGISYTRIEEEGIGDDAIVVRGREEEVEEEREEKRWKENGAKRQWGEGGQCTQENRRTFSPTPQTSPVKNPSHL